MTCAPATIAHLDVGFVPHRQWPLRRWFYADPLWYYSLPFGDDEAIASGSADALIDPELRELCGALHAAGLGTTPSCQGHFYAEDYYLSVYNQLLCERDAIVADGLIVRESQGRLPLLFRNPGYALPWVDFPHFLYQVTARQTAGYLGIVVPLGRPELFARLRALRRRRAQLTIRADQRVGRRLGARLLTIQTRPTDPFQRERLWREVTDGVLGALH